MPPHNFFKIFVDKFLINVDYVWIEKEGLGVRI
jgi:hypothetical protein